MLYGHIHSIIISFNNDLTFIHIVGANDEILYKMTKFGRRYDVYKTNNQACFFISKDVKKFIKKFKIQLVETKEELEIIKKLTIN